MEQSKLNTHIENKSHAPLYKTLGEVAALWTVANVGYYTILPLFGLRLSYNSAPIVIAVYFLLWAIVSTLFFWDLFKKNVTKKQNIWLYGTLSLGSAGLIWGMLYFFSFLPALEVPILSFNTDILFSTPWYFLPKSIEILVQQILIAVLVLEFYSRFNSLKETVISYAICFGLAHVLLFSINGAPTTYALMMIAGSVLSALIFPYLILRIRGGFIYAYVIHLVFYIILATILRTLPLYGYVF
ncbi:MAG: hypothetical protein UT29_C0002G0004 [Candidatus Yanofskybacteria bacterium GW2011_GWA1_39_13]|uniref:Abortive infection protein n=1 Tax=Yanofskybacteria sp. (strain GW2011_GWA1_39_13) TaxID=1619019 RepID=A0A0G0QL64_YANXG|nr:MAG: hypothetical protein UT29_C0002G0004 [Candidatus Yanofskybacteria bacterium GW2011_GWA1_39_13]